MEIYLSKLWDNFHAFPSRCCDIDLCVLLPGETWEGPGREDEQGAPVWICFLNIEHCARNYQTPIGISLQLEV